MRKILRNIVLMLVILTFSSCGAGKDDDNGAAGDKPGSDFKMTARVTELGEKIAVEVIESEYASGPYWVITADATEYFGKDGDRIDRSEIKVGDTVEILYSGQVMMSYPPQIVAARISVVG